MAPSIQEEEDDDMPQLSADTLALLQEFRSEKDTRDQQFAKLKQASESKFDQNSSEPLSMDLFHEDWNQSQFWYTDATARTLASRLLDGATAETRIAIVSAPSVYIALRNILAEDPAAERPQVVLMEYDRRFDVFGSEFVYYNFEAPLSLPTTLKSSFDRIICDPPFLSEDCQTKTALTVRWLAKDWSAEGLRLISCTGERMEGVILKLYGKAGVKTTAFEVKHSKGLSNEFRCYANFECADWKWA